MKKFYIILLALILTLAMIVPAGVANAAPKPLDNHDPTPVSGTYEVVSWLYDMADMEIVDGDGNYDWPNHIIIMELHGDLEGTIVQHLTYFGNIFDPLHYSYAGTETFQGTLMGRRMSYRAETAGSGEFNSPPVPEESFDGSESSVSTIISADSPLSHMRGEINFTSVFNLYSDPPVQDSTYTGELVWQKGKKN